MVSFKKSSGKKDVTADKATTSTTTATTITGSTSTAASSYVQPAQSASNATTSPLTSRRSSTNSIPPKPKHQAIKLPKRNSNTGGEQAAQTQTSADEYAARRSARVATGRYTADNDTWVEALAVCEMKHGPGGKRGSHNKRGSGNGGLWNKFKSKSSSDASATTSSSNHSNDPPPGTSIDPAQQALNSDSELSEASQNLTLRPYFQSQNTGQRVWDEPPSGASKIIYATPEVRKMAQAQLEEMRATYAQAALVRRREKEEWKREKKELNEGVRRGIREAEDGLVGALRKGLSSKFGGNRRGSASGSGDSGYLGYGGDGGNNSAAVPLVSGNGAEHAYNDYGNRNSSQHSSRSGSSAAIPPSVLKESVDYFAAAHDKHGSHGGGNKAGHGGSGSSQYEQDLQMAMLMSMGIGGGSVMGAGVNTTSNLSASAATKSLDSSLGLSVGLTREEQEQLAMATALSLSEANVVCDFDFAKEQAKKYEANKKKISSSKQLRHKSKDGSTKSSKNGSQSREQYPVQQVQHHHQQQSLDHEQMKMPPISHEELNDQFDGGGKMPALPTPPSQSANANPVNSPKGSYHSNAAIATSATSNNANNSNTHQADVVENKSFDFETEWIHEEKKIASSFGHSRMNG